MIKCAKLIVSIYVNVDIMSTIKRWKKGFFFTIFRFERKRMPKKYCPAKKVPKYEMV